MNKAHSQPFTHIKMGIRHIPQISQCDGAHFSDVEYVKALRDLFEAHLLLWRPHIFKLKMSFLGLICGFYIESALYGWLSISRIKVHPRLASSTAYGYQPHCMDKDQCLCLVRQCLLFECIGPI